MHNIYQKINNHLKKNNKTNEPYLWLYNRDFLSYLESNKLAHFEKILSSNQSPLLLLEETALKIAHFLLHIYSTEGLFLPIKQEYEAGRENMAFFSRASRVIKYNL